VRHNHDIFPYFLSHAKKVFPHLDCIDELKLISDLTNPPNWYPEARAMSRKVIFHGGPTNSGKTYHALERFFAAKSGIYCGPLKLLAVEVSAFCYCID
jgi:ATP-dependent RNA helicase SUPV3L1/SUV3